MKKSTTTATAVTIALLGLALAPDPHAYVAEARAQSAEDTGKGDPEPPAQMPKLAETPWEVKCATPAKATEAVCEMSKQVAVAKSRQLVARVSLGDGTPDELLIRVLLPHGLSLPEGATLTVDDGEPRQMAFATSTAAGVVARMPADASIMKELRAGKSLRIGATSRSKKPLNISLSLSGFSSSLDKLQ